MHEPPDPAADSSSDSNTRRLARAARDGGEAPFAALYERVAPALYTWACLRIRPEMRGFVDPQDVVQEVWCRAWKGIDQFDADEASFRHWVFRIAKNVMLEAFRKHERQKRSAAAAGPSTRMFQLQNLPDSATNISRRVARHEGIQTLLAWVQELEEDERKLFVHCGLEGLSYAEVAERMQINRDAVAKRWQVLRARVGQFGVSDDLIVGE